MIRRRLLLGATALSLGACGILAPAVPTVAAWASKAQAFAAGLSAVVPQVSTVTGIPADQATLAQNALTSAASYAASLAKITDPATATPVLQQVEQAFGAALAALTPFLSLLPPPIGPVVLAAQVILPVIEALINPQLASSRVTVAAPSSMTPATAELILLGAAASAKK